MGLRFSRMFTQDSQHVFDTCTWEKRASAIKEAGGNSVFEMTNVEVPSFWSQLATDILASKYLRKTGVDGGGETSLKQVVSRIVMTIADFGMTHGYFADAESKDVFVSELAYMLIHQYGAFNSPVWFNCGLFQAYGIKGQGGAWAWSAEENKVVKTKNAYEFPQSSACFINSVEDDLMSIFGLVKTEARLFKYGSGAGTNFSTLRGHQEKLSGGGTSSGLMSFLDVFDRASGATKSGGTTRRAARMVCLDVDHPEIFDFVRWKVREEKKAHALIAAGYGSGFEEESYRTVSGQNSNNSVRVTKDFMTAVFNDGEWQTKARTDGRTIETFKARKLWQEIAESAWACADPGLQFDTTINDWHTCKETGPIRASNPCCFTGDMLVDTSEGPISFETLENMSARGETMPYAFSFDRKTNLPVLRPIKKAWVAGTTGSLVRVETVRGLVITCTPEHRWLCRNGEYVEAQNLKPGARLRKIGRSVNEHRSGRRYLNFRATSDFPNGTQWQNRFMWEQMRGPIPEGFHVHHKDGDATNDKLSNFELRDGLEHVQEHSTGESNPRFIDSEERILVEAWDDIETRITEQHAKNASAYERMVALNSKGISPSKIAAVLDEEGFVNTRSEPWQAKSVQHALRQGYVGRRDVSVTISRWNDYVWKNSLNGILPLANARGIRGKSWEEFGAWIEERLESVNDRVASVTHVSADRETKVYDIEVEGTHNFGVTCPNAKSVHTVVVSNSEYMFLDDTACNLASLNLTKFYDANVPDSAREERFKHAVRVFITAQDILVDLSSYPTKKIAQNSHDYRPLGLGYANLGALLMTLGVPYDSTEGRRIASSLTSLLTGEAYAVSAELARNVGPFAGFGKNRESMLDVLKKHMKAAGETRGSRSGDWVNALDLGFTYGFRNAQVTVLAPTGTISFLMDCDTTGVEPDFSLIKFKKLAGGGSMVIPNRSVERALSRLGYSSEDRAALLAHLEKEQTLETCPLLQAEHMAVFDCASQCGVHGKRVIDPMGHLHMLAAVQPFLSGAVSKTLNCPNDTTVDEVRELHEAAYRLGLKSVALYRDGCKASQPLTSGNKAKETSKMEVTLVSRRESSVEPTTLAEPAALRANAARATASTPPETPSAPPSGPSPLLEPLSPRASRMPRRYKLPRKRGGFTQQARVAGHKIFLRTGEYADGTLGEIFIDLHKEGAALRSVMSCFSAAISIGLQYGVPLERFVEHFIFTRFEPYGIVEGHDRVKMSTSIVDYIFRVLAVEYLKRDDLAHVSAPDLADPETALAPSQAPSTLSVASPPASSSPSASASEAYLRAIGTDAPMCNSCGHLTVRNGACYKCLNCGNSLGCS